MRSLRTRWSTGRGGNGLAVAVMEFVRTRSGGWPRVVLALMAAELATPVLGVTVGRGIALVWLASMWGCAIALKLYVRLRSRLRQDSADEVDTGAVAELA